MNSGHERISKLDGNTFFFKNRQRKCEYTPGTQVLLRYTISCHANALYFVQCLQKKSKPLFNEHTLTISGIVLDKKLQRNASKLDILLELKNTAVVFSPFFIYFEPNTLINPK